MFVDEIPKGATGKLQRRGLAQQLGLADRDGQASPPRPAYLAPRSDLERQVAALFGEILEASRVGASDDFFALGGDSVTAAALVAEVCERGLAGPDLAAASLLWAPTVEEFAEFLATGRVTPTGSHLVPLQPEGDLPPLFLPHPHDGDVLAYAQLARRLGTERPVFGLEARGLDGILPPHTRIEEMARAYVADLRELQPAGPYFLGGLCMGATIAFEMARQLAQAGETVALLALIDPTPGRLGRRDRVVHRLVYYRELVAVHAHRGDLGAWLLRKLTGRKQPKSDPGPVAERRPDPGREAFLIAMREARDSYVPLPYPGRVTVFRSPRSSVPCSFWRRYATGVHSQALPSTRSREERQALVAERFRAALAEAAAGTQPGDGVDLLRRR